MVGLANQTLKANKNESFKIQDDKAKKHAAGTLNVAVEGGVYFTDTSGSGKRRADTMAKIDKWIDEHGGTPQAPSSSGGVSKNIANGDYAHIFDVPYYVVQPYGKTPWSQGGGAWMYPMGRHSGIDLQGVGYETRDVLVFSATGGRVHYVGPDPMGGYYIIITPDFGGYIYYGHMKSSQVSTG